MNREELFKYVKQKYNTTPEYPWEKSLSDAVLKNKNNKWYGLIMNISKEKLGLNNKENVDVLNLKCLPEMIGGLRMEKGFFPAYHMNKEHWITILLDGSVELDKIKPLIDLSHDLTC